jgi:hypothetical protein
VDSTRAIRPRPRARSRWLRRRCLLAAAIAGALTAGGGSAQAAPLPPQGIYEQCAPNSATPDCGQRLRLIADAGFDYVLNYTAWFGSAQQVRRYADQAQAAGVQLIWPLNDKAWRDGTSLVKHYRYLGPDCDCNDNAAFKRFAVDLVKDHPATWGFYTGDEAIPSEQNVAQIAKLSEEIEQLAPGKPRLYITLPRDDLTAQLEPFVPAADVAGTDYYPVGMAPDLSRIPDVARTTREVTSRYGRRSALVLQAFSWHQYYPGRPVRFPTRDEMQRMRDLALAHGDPDMVLWYAFNDLFEMDHALQRWHDLEQAAFAPFIQLSRSSRSCAARRLRFNVRVGSVGGLRTARALVDGKVVRRSSKGRFRLRLRARLLRPGRHRLRVLAVDGSGRRAAEAVGFRRCRS